jgi:hypothetical protein
MSFMALDTDVTYLAMMGVIVDRRNDEVQVLFIFQRCGISVYNFARFTNPEIMVSGSNCS